LAPRDPRKYLLGIPVGLDPGSASP
jgi:hypothetical protein